MTSRILLFIVAVWLPACGMSDAVSEHGGEGGAPGSAGEGGGGGTDDFEVLAACWNGACNVPSLAQLIEAQLHNISISSVGCVLAALRDRTPGAYAHQTDSTFSNGSVGAHHAIVVTGDGAVLYARSRYAYAGAPVMPYDPEPGRRCVLKPSSYFSGCLDAIERPTASMDPEAWSCAFGDGAVTTPSTLLWFESCEDESPASCP